MNPSRAENSRAAVWSYAEQSAPGAASTVSSIPTLARDNPQPATLYDLAVIGAGVAGTAAALSAAERGAKVALVERAASGGAARSRALCAGLLEAAGHVHALRARLAGVEGSLDFSTLMARLRERPAQIAPDALSCLHHPRIDVFAGPARFLNEGTLSVSGLRLKFERALIATGSQSAFPGIEGLHDAGYLTRDSLPSLTHLPARLVVIGGGRTGSELAQAFTRLGSQVTLIEVKDRLLPSEDAGAAEVVAAAFAEEGVRVLTGTQVVSVTQLPTGARRVFYERGLTSAHADCDEVLVALGHAPVLDGLGLEAAGVEFDRDGIRVDDFLRTSNRRVLAAGDVCRRPRLGLVSAAHGRIAAHNALSWPRRRAAGLVVPRFIRTDPQIVTASAGAPDIGRERLTRLSVALGSTGLPTSSEAAGEFVQVDVRGRAGAIARVLLVTRRADELFAPFEVALNTGLTLRAVARGGSGNPGTLFGQIAEQFVRRSRSPGFRDWVARHLLWSRARRLTV
jgi:pyruvate/2-oxoglutarate dehydrogenase complex dihydrolipoamide dehydrogenase (E3) component